jgi:hypothetical protein
MSVYKVFLLSSAIFLISCSNGSSIIENKKICRNYATISMTNGGLTETCSFDKTRLVFSCFLDSGTFFDKEYRSIKDFVLESQTLGLIKAASKRTFGPIHANYIFDANKLISENIDLSALGGPYYLNIDYEIFDAFERPTSGIISSNAFPDCSGSTVVINYDEFTRSVSKSVIPEQSCPNYRNNVSVFDVDGNLIRFTYTDSVATEYTVQTKDEVCF